jgi:predicted MFS family arabinose efflux permease
VTSARSLRLSQNLWVRLSVALAFADASIVVLALPQIVDRLHTSIGHSLWVIMAYNLALIAGSALVMAAARRLPSTPTLIGGLVLFGLASIGCGLSDALSALIPFRVVQGIGGALILAASLPVFAGAARPGDSPLNGWSAAAAIGAAIGPAAGGILTQLFDWRSIFLTQAPVAAVAAIAVFLMRREARGELAAEADRPSSPLDPLTANVALLLLSAGVIGALFLIVIELINAWSLTPIGAAAVVSAIPLSTAAAERLVRGRSPVLLGSAGAVLMAIGLIILGLLRHRELGVVVIALLLCGSGLGLGYPGLTASALESGGSTTARAAKTVAARDLGVVVGLVVLGLWVFVPRLDAVVNSQVPQREATAEVLAAPISPGTKFALGARLIAALNAAGKTSLPNIGPAFAQTEATAPVSEHPALERLRGQLNVIVARASRQVTRAFRRPFFYAAGFALLVLPTLLTGGALVRRRVTQPPPPEPTAATSA